MALFGLADAPFHAVCALMAAVAQHNAILNNNQRKSNRMGSDGMPDLRPIRPRGGMGCYALPGFCPPQSRSVPKPPGRTLTDERPRLHCRPVWNLRAFGADTTAVTRQADHGEPAEGWLVLPLVR